MWNLAKFTEIAANVMTTPQSRTPVQLLGKTVFKDNDRSVVALQQNPNTTSKWAALARQGHKVVQFRDQQSNAYVGVAVDGKVSLYDGTQRR